MDAHRVPPDAPSHLLRIVLFEQAVLEPAEEALDILELFHPFLP